MLEPNNNKHADTKSFLKFLGVSMVCAGGLFTAVGLISFFSAFGSFSGPPKYFWCCFVGMPLMGVGMTVCKFAFMGSVARYAANEIAPVGKDAFNYVAKESQEGIRDIASAISDGMAENSSQSPAESLIRCSKCNSENALDAKFCNECGTSILKTKACSSCGELNDGDAKFCDNCGGGF